MAKKDTIFLKLRFYTAGVSTMLLNLNIFGISLRGICSPGFNCHGCPWATFACPIGVMSFSSGVRQLPLMAIAFIIAIGAIFGRLICGFFCPFGWLQDLLYKIPGAKIKLPRFMNWFKYAFLVLFVFLLPYLLGFEKSGYLFLPDPKVDKGDPGMLKLTVMLENRGEKTVSAPSVNVVFIDKESKRRVIKKLIPFRKYP
jgi:polyferredoxin